MLFQYLYPEDHQFENLNQYLIHFINSIANANYRSRFVLIRYFHEDFIDILEDSPKLKSKFEAFFNSFKKLSEEDKNSFINRLNESQTCQNVFSDISIDVNHWKTESLNELVGDESFKQLADFLFTCVKYDRWQIKDHYQQIYDSLDHKICPFCGIHPMHQTFREDYDHLAAKSLYPLLAINPRNLAPMCHDCNCKNKGPTDVLYTEEGNRRVFVYPYGHHVSVSLDFDGSVIPQTDLQNENGTWSITFNPNNDHTNNWNEIFNIKSRYLDDFLIPNYDQWLTDFVKDCIDENIDLSNEDVIRDQLSSFARKFNRKWYEQANIIKGPLFGFLANCNNRVFLNSIIAMYNRLNRAA